MVAIWIVQVLLDTRADQGPVHEDHARLRIVEALEALAQEVDLPPAVRVLIGILHRAHVTHPCDVCAAVEDTAYQIGDGAIAAVLRDQ